MTFRDDYAPRGFIRFSLITCLGCNTKHIAPEGTDNAYKCNGCRVDLMKEEQIQYDISEKEFAEFLEKTLAVGIKEIFLKAIVFKIK